MEDRLYEIPANVREGGGLFGRSRNVAETVVVLLPLGFLLVMRAEPWRIAVAASMFVPLGVLTLVGIGGDSLGQFLCHVVRFLHRRRKIHLARMEGTE